MLSYQYTHHIHLGATKESRNDTVCAPQDQTTTRLESVTENSSDKVRDDDAVKCAILKAHADLEVAKEARKRMRNKLDMAQRKLREVKRKHRTQQEDHFLEMHSVLFHQIPGYKNSIPPVSWETVEAKDQVGPYEVHALLGEGGFAKVYKCRHESAGTWHAIKCLDKSKITSIKELAQLGREIEVMRWTDHPNVLRATDVIHAAKNIYIVMELGAIDLWGYIYKYDKHNYGLPEGLYREVMRGLLEGLECLHQHGVAHCDLKPENILIRRDVPPEQLTSDDVVICDFGLCQQQSTTTSDSSSSSSIPVKITCGTLGFISPELMLLRQQKKVNRNAYCEGRPNDMWSVGVMFMEMIGEKPRRWEKVVCGRHNHLEAYAIELEDILYDLHECRVPNDSALMFLRKMLCWDPTERWTATQALQHPWMTAGAAPTN